MATCMNPDHPTFPVAFADIEHAARRIDGHVHHTPVLTSAGIDASAGASVHLKAEHLQRAGSFKARGAHNRLLLLTDDERARGVVTVSSGNHGGALAAAGQRLGVTVDVYMPADAPALKRRACEAYGATVHSFDRHADDRNELLAAHVQRTGAVAVPPFDDPAVIAGQGTVALELHHQAQIDTLVVPMSGGGLMAGCAIASRHLHPTCRVIGVEPAGADDTARSFAMGAAVTVARPDTIADGLAIQTPGELTLPINLALVDAVVTVTDDEIVDAMRLLFERTKQVVEPSGAASLAAVLAGRIAGDHLGVVLSGGNIDIDRFAALCRGDLR
jgi:threonine dehydratase